MSAMGTLLSESPSDYRRVMVSFERVAKVNLVVDNGVEAVRYHAPAELMFLGCLKEVDFAVSGGPESHT